jgi:hypothetical protein
MNLISRKVTPKIKLYYLGAKPDWDLVTKVSQIFDGSAEPFKTLLPRKNVILLNSVFKIL